MSSPAARARSAAASAIAAALSAVPLEVRLGEVELEHDVQARRPGQRERTLEQRGGGRHVAATDRAPAGGGELLAGALAERGVGVPELAAEASACSRW